MTTHTKLLAYPSLMHAHANVAVCTPACFLLDRNPFCYVCMCVCQGNTAAAAAADTADDGFDDLFVAGFEELAEEEDGETGEKAERELHAKVCRRCRETGPNMSVGFARVS